MTFGAPHSPPAKDDRPLTGLLADLMSDLAELVQKEIQLAKAELSEKLSQAGNGAATLALGGLVAFAGLLELLDAAVLALAHVLEGAPAWLPALMVGALAVAAGVALLLRGKTKLHPDNLAPRRTVESLRQDAELIKEQVQ